MNWFKRLLAQAEGLQPPTALEDRSGAQSTEVGNVDIPAAASIGRYKQMRKHATLALARATATAPIRSSTPSYKLTEPATDDHLQFIRGVMNPLWADLIRNMCTGIDYGCKPFEKVWERSAEGGRLVFRKVKPLNIEKTALRLLPDGTFAGAKNGEVVLEEQYVFWYTHEREDDDFFGNARLANVEDPYERWVNAATRLEQYIRLVACPVPMLQYPKGKGRDASGMEKSNFAIAQNLVTQLGQGKAITMPNEVLAFAQKLIDRGVDPTKVKAWIWDFIEAKGQHGEEFVSILRYEDSLMFRGYLVPERAASEGQYGTKAEAEEHANIALACTQETLNEIIRHINWYLIDPLLIYNFGEQYAGTVEALAQKLVDEDLDILRRVVEKILGENAALFRKWIDVDVAMDQLGLPKVAEILQEEGEDEEEEEGPTAAIGKQLSQLYGAA